MNSKKNFRIINQTEKNIISKSLAEIEPKILSFLNKKEFIFFISFENMIQKSNYPIIYLIPDYLINIIDNFNLDISIISAGIYFGFIKRSKFYLSLEGAEFLYQMRLFSDKNYIVVNDKGEKAILYGNRIIKDFIYKIPENLDKNKFLLIFNQSNELISIAQSQVDKEEYPNLKSNDLVTLNLIDKGYYLRIKQ